MRKHFSEVFRCVGSLVLHWGNFFAVCSFPKMYMQICIHFGNLKTHPASASVNTWSSSQALAIKINLQSGLFCKITCLHSIQHTTSPITRVRFLGLHDDRRSRSIGPKPKNGLGSGADLEARSPMRAENGRGTARAGCGARGGPP